MPTNYPGSVDSYSTKVDNVSDVMAADINNLQDAMVAVQNRVGTTASPTFVTVGTNQTINGDKTLTGLTTFTNGRTQIQSAGLAMLEMHLPGTHARALYLDSSGTTRLATTNGGGVASTVLLSVDTAGVISGNGSGLTNLNGSNISSGNIPAARITNALNASGSAPIYACRAWVNFNGTTSPGTIRASGNVSSVTRNGTGDYTVNFTTAMSGADYAEALSVQVASSTFFRSAYVTDTGKTTGSLRFLTVNGANAVADFPGISVAIFR